MALVTKYTVCITTASEITPRQHESSSTYNNASKRVQFHMSWLLNRSIIIGQFVIILGTDLPTCNDVVRDMLDTKYIDAIE